MKKMTFPIPDGLQLPMDAATKPFSLSGKFLLMDGGLRPLELGGVAIEQPCGHGEEDDEEYEKEEDGCCGAYKKGQEHMCPDCQKKGVGFLVAVEKAVKRN